eukprot:scaffold7215_cov366-Prasinococcus_capsulatus_cf.AAC.8
MKTHTDSSVAPAPYVRHSRRLVTSRAAWRAGPGGACGARAAGGADDSSRAIMREPHWPMLAGAVVYYSRIVSPPRPPASVQQTIVHERSEGCLRSSQASPCAMAPGAVVSKEPCQYWHYSTGSTNYRTYRPTHEQRKKHLQRGVHAVCSGDDSTVRPPPPPPCLGPRNPLKGAGLPPALRLVLQFMSLGSTRL